LQKGSIGRLLDLVLDNQIIGQTTGGVKISTLSGRSTKEEGVTGKKPQVSFPAAQKQGIEISNIFG